jgi:hypothetical protein
MNTIDQWEAEEAAAQLAALRKEDAAFAALPVEERTRISQAKCDRLEAVAVAAEAADADEDDEDEDDEDDDI